MKPLGMPIIQNMSYFYKKNVKRDKNQRLFYFFSVSKLAKSKNSFKTLDCVKLISF